MSIHIHCCSEERIGTEQLIFHIFVPKKNTEKNVFQKKKKTKKKEDWLKKVAKFSNGQKYYLSTKNHFPEIFFKMKFSTKKIFRWKSFIGEKSGISYFGGSSVFFILKNRDFFLRTMYEKTYFAVLSRGITTMNKSNLYEKWVSHPNFCRVVSTAETIM